MREAGAGCRRDGDAQAGREKQASFHPLKHSKNRVKAVPVSVSLPDFISLLLYRMLVVMFQAVSLPAALLCSAFDCLSLLSPAGNPRRRGRDQRGRNHAHPDVIHRNRLQNTTAVIISKLNFLCDFNYLIITLKIINNKNCKNYDELLFNFWIYCLSTLIEVCITAFIYKYIYCNNISIYYFIVFCFFLMLSSFVAVFKCSRDFCLCLYYLICL